ncbi:S-layer homology domain-containing protein [Paenibacillus andongensis]|uniref:S-layer homology domain-containing protein n=1 Tax=Paenibacillus andongensis TaxID=2975482 RepID=UPI0021BA76C0|nr:S-layer homology domain-containing protein [Paenibacillus andongensis]
MKKQLTFVLTSVMAVSMFSSVALGKTSSNFTDLSQLDAATKAKFDAMISAGIFDGMTETTFGLKSQMNRAQFAKVAAMILELPINAGLRVSSFTDVSTYDQANGYALPYIEALKTAGITNGVSDGAYNPAGLVTKEELAAFLIRILGKDAEASHKTLTDGSVSNWAKGYVALALNLKLFPETIGAFEGLMPATRELLVTGAYEAKQQYVPGKIALVSAQAIGASKVKVWFNQTVDKTKANLTLSKGTLHVPVTVTWSDDGKSATLLTSSTISEGEYTVAISGLDASTVSRNEVYFRAQAEQVTEINFVNPEETIANSSAATIKVKALNQYGETATLGTSGFTAIVAGSAPADFKKDEWGNLNIIANVKMSQMNEHLPVTVYVHNSKLSAARSFKVGNAPVLSFIEPNKIIYSNMKTRLIEVGDKASISLNLFDQYGNPIIKKQLDLREVTSKSLVPVVSPENPSLEIVKAGTTLGTTDLFDENGNARFEVRLTAKPLKESTHKITIYSEAANAMVSVDVN